MASRSLNRKGPLSTGNILFASFPFPPEIDRRNSQDLVLFTFYTVPCCPGLAGRGVLFILFPPLSTLLCSSDQTELHHDPSLLQHFGVYPSRPRAPPPPLQGPIALIPEMPVRISNHQSPYPPPSLFFGSCQLECPKFYPLPLALPRRDHSWRSRPSTTTACLPPFSLKGPVPWRTCPSNISVVLPTSCFSLS